jgi:heme-degrading monooxygenase HmoA
MAFALVSIKTGDFEKWKVGFEAASSLRKSYGSKGVRAFRNTEKPDEILVLGEYESLEKAKEMFASQEFREAVKNAGLSSPPTVAFLDQVGQLPN